MTRGVSTGGTPNREVPGYSARTVSDRASRPVAEAFQLIPLEPGMAGARRRTLTLRYRGVTLLLLGAAWMALAEVMFRVVTNPRLHKPALEVAGGWGVVALAGLGVLAIILTMLAGADQAKAAERALADNLRSIELVTEASLALLPLEELLDALLSRLMGALRAEVAVIFLVSEDGRKLVVRA